MRSMVTLYWKQKYLPLCREDILLMLVHAMYFHASNVEIVFIVAYLWFIFRLFALLLARSI